MQRSGGLLNFTANQDASAMSLGPSVCCSSPVLCLDLLDFLIWFSFVQLPHNERSLLYMGLLGGEKKTKQNGSVAL